MTLTDFLLARIAEDEAAIDEVCSDFYNAPFDEARMLAECEAKRRVVERHQSSADTRGVGQHRNGRWTPYCEYDFEDWPCPDVTDLVAVYTVYTDHPDYRPEWKP